MRLVHVIASLGAGGTQSQLRQLVPALAARGCEQHVVLLLDREVGARSASVGSATIWRLHGQDALWALPLRLRARLREIRPDVVLCWLYHSNVLATLVGVGAPLIWNVRHSLHDPAGDKPLTRFVISLGAQLSRRPARIVFNSQRAALQHFERGYERRHAVTIENGYDTDHWSADAKLRDHQRLEWQVPDDQWIIGLLGRYHPTKGIGAFLSAMRSVIDSRNDVKVILAGDGMVEANTRLAEAIAEAGLGRHVRLLGHVSDVRGVLNAVDIVVSASLGEASSNVVAEAMAVGATCVVTDVGESSRLVGQCGIVLPDGAPDSIAGAVLGVIADGRPRWKERAALGSAHIRQHYSLRRAVEAYHRLCQDVCRESVG